MDIKPKHHNDCYGVPAARRPDWSARDAHRGDAASEAKAIDEALDLFQVLRPLG